MLALAVAIGCSGSGDPGGPRGEGRPDLEAVPPLPPASPERLFTEVTRAAGIGARHLLPPGDLGNVVDATGAGAAFADLDGDGWLEIVITGGPLSPGVDDPQKHHGGFHLYRNLQDGRFEEITDRSGVPSSSSAVAVAVGDVDGDGDRDLYLVDRGRNRLYRNRGDAVFEDVTEEAGVGDPHFGVGAVFFDLEGDGDLDLYVTNYLEFDLRETSYYEPDGFPGPLAYRPEPDVLYRNRGDGTFEDVSSPSGVAELRGRGMSLVAADVDDDGDTDVFVANDATENFLLVNDGNGRFSEEGLLSGLGMGENGEQTSAMSADLGDVDGDGQLDLVVSDTAFGALYLRVQPGFFLDEVMGSGLAALSGQYVSWGQNLLDFDNDGDLDLFIVNSDLHHLVGWEDLLLRNTGEGRFEDASAAAGEYFASRRTGRCSVTGDYDNDGDIDVLVTTLQGTHALLRNDHPGAAAWLTLDLVGRRGRDPFGTRISVEAGGRRFLAESRCPSVFLGQSDVRVHFGLGEAVGVVDAIRIDWPDGTHQTLENVPARQVLRVVQGAP